jgi:hypothetical protein
VIGTGFEESEEEDNSMSTGNDAAALAKELDAASTMLATELVEKMLKLTPVALSSDRMIGLILNPEIAFEFVKVAEIIAREPHKCLGKSKTDHECKITLATQFIENLGQWLEALEAKKKSRIIRAK